MDKKQRIRKRASTAAPGHTPSYAPSNASLNLYQTSSHDEHSGTVGHRQSPSPTATPKPRHLLALKPTSQNSSINLQHSSPVGQHDQDNAGADAGSFSFAFAEPKHAESTETLSSSNTMSRRLPEEREQQAVVDIESVEC